MYSFYNMHILSKMRLLFLVVVGFYGVFVVEAGRKWVDQGVEIEVLYEPSNCTYRSQMKDMLTTDYIGKFPDGKKFDSTYDRKEAMTYIMGQGDVIKGCEIGTMKMCKGEKRYLVIPPNLAYGSTQYGQIPPNSTLTFEIVLTDLQEDPFRAFDP